MPDESSPHDTLPSHLQAVVDKKLASGEEALMTLSGASGEALVVTDRRVMIVREQMPIVGSETEVDCFDYSYEQIRTVLVEGAVGSGHLKLALFAPPPDDHHVTLVFPSYDLARFDMAAARIRLLVEQTQGLTAIGNPAAPAAPVGAVCPKCSAKVDAHDLFCAECGTPQGIACGCCQSLLPANAHFCPRCGSSASAPRSLTCSLCHRPIAAFFAYCPHCGQTQGRRCLQCGAPVLPDWERCPGCGNRLEASLENRPPVWTPTEAPPTQTAAPEENRAAAEEQNARGMRLYEQERYEEAVQAFERALDLAPGTALYHCNLGVVYAEMGRDEEALEEYETAIRLAPNDPAAYLNMGYFFSERENDEEAVRAWQKVIELAPDSPEAEEARQNIEHTGEV